MPTDNVRPSEERTLTRWRHSDEIGFFAEQEYWLGKKCQGNSNFTQNSLKTTEGCASALTSPIRWGSVNCLHKRVRRVNGPQHIVGVY